MYTVTFANAINTEFERYQYSDKDAARAVARSGYRPFNNTRVRIERLLRINQYGIPVMENMEI